MDIHMQAFERKSKLPSIAIAVVVHALMLGLALQTSTYISPVGRPIIDLLPPDLKEEPLPKPLEKEKLITPSDLKPLKPFVPTMPFLPETDTPPITYDFDNLEPLSPQPRQPVNGGGEDIIRQHSPVHQLASVDSNACEKPSYPSNSLRMGEEGTVNLVMQIGTDGKVLDARIEKSSGSKALDRAAVAGLSLCTFKPANTDGVPEKSWAKLQYVWTLDN